MEPVSPVPTLRVRAILVSLARGLWRQVTTDWRVEGSWMWKDWLIGERQRESEEYLKRESDTDTEHLTVRLSFIVPLLLNFMNELSTLSGSTSGSHSCL